MTAIHKTGCLNSLGEIRESKIISWVLKVVEEFFWREKGKNFPA